MAEELEIKLSLTPGALSQARQWLLAQAGVRAGSEKTLVNCYYDTPNGELNRQKVALRVRKAGDRYIQTLKTQGAFVDGAHKRQEWEWPLTGTDLNIGLLADTPIGEGVNLAELVPVFETNFLRRVVMLEGANAIIECALDQGTIEAGGNTWDLCELELELKEGKADSLQAWARELAAQIPVFLNLISKAEQGYALAGLHQPAPLTEADPLVTRVFHGLARTWLTGLADRALESDLNTLGEHPALSDHLKKDLVWLQDQLQSGVSVADLAKRSTRLGQFQLALLSLDAD